VLSLDSSDSSDMTDAGVRDFVAALPGTAQ